MRISALYRGGKAPSGVSCVPLRSVATDGGLKEYYTDNVAYVKIGNELLDPIEVTKGLRQG